MKRDRAADAARGIGVILVVIGHFYAGGLVNYIFSFHMPLFFFLTGRLTDTSRPFGQTVLRRARGTLVPYAALFLISFALENVRLFYLKSPVDPAALARAFFLSGGYLNDVPINNFPLWYLPHSFLASLVLAAAVKASGGRRPVLAALTALLAAAAIPFQALVTGRPALHINALPVSAAFMLAGHLTRGVKVRYAPYLAAPALFAGWGVSYLIGWAHVARVGSGWYYLAAALSIFGVLSVSERVESPALEFIGRNSIVFYGLHMFVFSRLVPRLALPPAAEFAAGMAVLAACAWARERVRGCLRAKFSAR